MGCTASSPSTQESPAVPIVSLTDKQPVNEAPVNVSKWQVIFVLGGPGSGKGTNCDKIVRDYGFIHLSAGDLLREEKASGSDLAAMINQCIVEGKIVPAEVTVRLLHNAMASSGGARFLVDGFPRDLENLTCWEEQMNSDADVLFLLFLDCDEKIMTERLLERGKTSGRSDDNLETIVKRFRVYEEQTRPIVARFEEMGKVRTVDSNGSQDEVYSQVQAIFDTLPR